VAVQKLFSRSKKQVLKRWLREDENLSGTKEKMVYICEPKVGENLSKEEVR
jgi:hypothetical protein